MPLRVSTWARSKINKNGRWSAILGKNYAGMFGPIQAPSKSPSWNLGVGRGSLNGSELGFPAPFAISS
jgi:hypothetical protein